MVKFTVDTHLFRELGELLVGRDSTALVELIKNAYDADAPEVTVYGVNLNDREKGFIKITDTGVGMTEKEFTNGFLRIASRYKEEGTRFSKIYKRRYTGAKGVGRLAAHKLASLLEIYSVSSQVNSQGLREAITASIDWDLVEKQKTLDDVEHTSAITFKSELVSKRIKQGTEITLRRLRKKWTSAERQRFLREAQTFEPPSVLVSSLSNSIINKPVLFDTPKVQDIKISNPGFEIKFEGDFASGDDYWQTLAQTEGWIIEIDATKDKEIISYAIAPNQHTLKKYPFAKKEIFHLAHPNSKFGPFLQARIFVREGKADLAPAVRNWANDVSGIRVFMEGFRVLPYGEANNDWLSINFDYVRRGRGMSPPEPFQKAFEIIFPQKEMGRSDRDIGLTILSQKNYFGGVFLTQENAPSLQVLVNREGFVPNESFEGLVNIVRTAIDLSTRVRAKVRFNEREERKTKKEKVSERDLESLAGQAKSLANEARQLAIAGDFKKVEEKISHISDAVEELSNVANRLIEEGRMLRVLASVGTEMAAFIHEINGLLGLTEVIDIAISRMRDDSSLERKTKKDLATLQSNVGDLKRSLERQSRYLVDVVSPDAQRRRVRLNFSERFNAAIRLVERMAERRGIAIYNEIPPELKSPPMFSAELTAVFANLLTNAVKAAGQDGKILAIASQESDGTIRIKLENTGVKVDLIDSEKWFRPFETTTTAVDPVLGQGMGLGLPITRKILEERGGDLKFVSPSHEYATAVEIKFTK